MDNLLFCVLILLLLYYFFYYLPQQRKRSFGEAKSIKSEPKLTHSQGTQTDDLTTEKINLLIKQWNQVAEWATEEGIDINKKWNLNLLKQKVQQKLNNPDPQLENTLDTLIKDIQDFNKQL